MMKRNVLFFGLLAIILTSFQIPKQQDVKAETKEINLLYSIPLLEEPEEIEEEKNEISDLIGEKVESYLLENKINKESIGFGFIDLTSKEEFWINKNVQFVAASSIKFPLGVIIYDKISKGEISMDEKITYLSKHNVGGTTILPRYYKIGSKVPMSTLLKFMLINSDNNTTQILFDRLNQIEPLQDVMTSFYGVEKDEIKVYGNRVTPNYFMKAIIEVNNNEEKYAQLIEYLSVAYPNRYLKKYINDVPMFHKCGFYAGNINDVGIVYGDNPYAIVIMTKQVKDAEKHIGKLNQLVYETIQAKYKELERSYSRLNEIEKHQTILY